MNINDKSIKKIIEIEKDFLLLKYHNTTDNLLNEAVVVNRADIQIHFALHNSSKLIHNNGMSLMDIQANNSFLLFNPDEQHPINIELLPESKYMLLLVRIDKFHTFFSKEARIIHFDKKTGGIFSNVKELSAREIVVINEIFNFNLDLSVESLYTKGKVFELLSIFFNKKNDSISCPYLKNEKNVKKIRKAKDIITQRVNNPPGLQELASMVELPLNKLKEGFKQIYGITVFGFLLNYKMELAKNMIESKNHNVAEISHMLGYSTSSHFIAAFKDKYGTTPKKFMSGLVE